MNGNEGESFTGEKTWPRNYSEMVHLHFCAMPPRCLYEMKREQWIALLRPHISFTFPL